MVLPKFCTRLQLIEYKKVIGNAWRMSSEVDTRHMRKGGVLNAMRVSMMRREAAVGRDPQ